MFRIIATTIVAATMFSTGCAGKINVETPNGFAELEGRSDYDFRATNAEGVVLAVRHAKNDPQGDLSFWSGAVDAHLRRSGYEATASQTVKSADGVAGKRIEYSVEMGARPHAFWVTVFVTKDRVVTVEAGGDVAFFEGQADAIDQAIGSIRVGS